MFLINSSLIDASSATITPPPPLVKGGYKPLIPPSLLNLHQSMVVDAYFCFALHDTRSQLIRRQYTQV